MYNTILVPVDGSLSADRASDHALELAARFDAAVHALYVVDTSSETRFVAGGTADELQETLRARGEEATGAVVDRAVDRGVEAVAAVREGVPHAVVLDYADEVGADLVVMGAHGSAGPDRDFLLGSVTDRVVRAAPIPVHVVPGVDVAVGDVGTATEIARTRVTDAGYAAPVVVSTHRSGERWLVRLRDDAGDHHSVAVDVETGDATLRDGDADRSGGQSRAG
ncbi:MAG: universal stress protein [Halobacteriaceae archaeon]